MPKREHWSNKFAFVMATGGAAIGLGSIWRFPYVCGENGGAAFLLAYLFCVIVIASPILIGEITLGKTARRGSGGAFRLMALSYKKFWNIVGIFAVILGFLIMTYYSIIAGWTLEYLYQSITGGLTSLDASQAEGFWQSFMLNEPRQIFWHLVFTLIVVAVIFTGLRAGIEKLSEILMPLLFLILIGLVIFALNLEADLSAAPRALTYLFTPDWSKFTSESFFMALGQATFSLSLAMGTMTAYGSYLDDDVNNVPMLGGIVIAMDTIVAILSALIIFPIIFTYGLNPEAGTGLIFVTLPALLAKIPAGLVIAPIFYALLFFAALASAISLLEPAVTHLVDEHHWQRQRAAVLVGITSILLGALWIITNSLESKSLFLNIDRFCSDILVPVSTLATTIYLGWFSSVLDNYKFGRLLVKYLCPIGIGWILIRGLL